MSIEVKVPTLGESVSEATVGQWLKKPGDTVAVDEPIASLETDKVAVEVPGEGTYEGTSHASSWRRAEVLKRLFASGSFSANVCLPDGTPDPGLVKTCHLDAEGREWRRVAPMEEL